MYVSDAYIHSQDTGHQSNLVDIFQQPRLLRKSVMSILGSPVAHDQLCTTTLTIDVTVGLDLFKVIYGFYHKIHHH